MAYPYGAYPGYMPGYYAPNAAMPDQLAQLRAAQQIPQPMQQPMPQSGGQGGGNGIIWVQGEAGAKSYMVAPGNTLLLMDSENCTFYIKSVDGAGIPSMRRFDYTERTQGTTQQNAQPAQDYVTRAEFDALSARIDAMGMTRTRRMSAKEDTGNGESAV